MRLSRYFMKKNGLPLATEAAAGAQAEKLHSAACGAFRFCFCRRYAAEWRAMPKRFSAIICALAVALLLSGCGGVFNKEYVHISDYVPSTPDAAEDAERVTVENLTQLKQAILELVSLGTGEGMIYFDPSYDGDVTEDLADACWQVRTQDALCAYCVENIAYDLNKIVSYYEAKLSVSYSSAWETAGDIVRLKYATGTEDAVLNAMSQGLRRLVVLIDRSSLSGEDMQSLVTRVYRANPIAAPAAPTADINMFSGSGNQRLYEINFSYGLSNAELEARRKALSELEPFAGLDTETLDAPHRALAAAEYLTVNCRYDLEGKRNEAYSALIERSADSEGLALAYVELCRELDVDCQIVYGQEDWVEHCWNIVELDGGYYHVDISACLRSGMEAGFLLRDNQLWGIYRWNVASYPACQGELDYSAVGE